MRPQKVAVALGAVLVTAGCASAPDRNAGAPFEQTSRYDGGVEQLLLYCSKLRDGGELATAASICERAHNIAPSDPRPLLKLGEIFAAMERLPQAAAVYQMILEQTPHHGEARYFLGKTYVAMGRHDLALQELQFTLTQNPDDARVYNALGIANSMLGNQDAARQAFEGGLKVAPGDIPLRNNLGLALVLAGDHADGIAMLQAAAADPAANATTIRNLRLAESLAQAANNGQAAAIGTPIYHPATPAGPAQTASAITDNEFSAMIEPVTAAPRPDAAATAAAPPPSPTEPVMLAEALKPLSDDTQMTVVGIPVYLDSEASDQALEATAEADAEPVPTADASEEPAAALWPEADARQTAIADADATRSGRSTDEISTASMPQPFLTTNTVSPAGKESGPTAILQSTMTADVSMAPPTVTAPQARLTASLGGEDAYSVQLAAYRSADRAQDGWRQIRAKALDLLENVDPVIRRSDQGSDKGVYYRLRTKASSKAAANQLCAALQARGIGCLTIKESPVGADEADAPAAAKS